MIARSTSLLHTLGKLTIAIGVFVAIVGGWAWAGPLITRRLPLPDRAATDDADCAVWFVGSSSIRHWASLPRDMPGWRHHNRGIDGALLDEIDSRLLATRGSVAPVAIVAYAGENDINAGASGAAAAEAMMRLARHARSSWPQAPLFIIGLKPSPVRWDQRPRQLAYNDRIRDFARTHPGVTYLPAGAALMAGGRPDPTLFVDGVHMNDRGYALWSRDVRRGFEAALSSSLRAACAAAIAG